MSQEYNTISKKARRARNRARPVLVTGNEKIQSEQPAPITEDLIEESEPVVEQEAPVAEVRTLKASFMPRMPGFFSNVGKSGKAEEAKESDVVQARLARATRGKAKAAATSATETETASEKEETKSKTSVPARANAQTSTRPPSPFKMRYVAGMAVYLFGAQFLLPVEKTLLLSIHSETVYSTFSLFGFPVQLSTSFILNIVTLVGLLYILVKLDYLPGSLRGASPAARSGQSQNRNSEPVIKQAPPAIRQGVKGSDDNLYQEYRINQRREKKR